MAQPLVLVADDQGRYVDVNDEAVRVLGFTREELLMLSVWDLTPLPQELDGLILWQAFINEGRQQGEYVLKTKDGALLQCRYDARANVQPGRHESRLTIVGSGPVRAG